MTSLPFPGAPLQALLATLMTWLVTALGAALVLLIRRPRPTLMNALMAFGAGVMLASSYFSLLAPCVELAEAAGQRAWLVSGGGFLTGGLAMLLGDALLARSSLAQASHRRRSLLLITSITLHNFPEGLAVGVAFGAAAAGDAPALMAAWALAVGIALQNLPEGAAVSLPLRRDGLSRGRAFFWGQLSGAVEPVAGLLGALLAAGAGGILPFLLSFAAGAMVCVVLAELVPECARDRRPALMTTAALCGFTMMMVLDVAL